MVKHAEALLRKGILMRGLDEDKDEYKEDDRKHDIPGPPSRRRSSERMAEGRDAKRVSTR